MLPAGTKQHDIEFMFTPKPDVDLDQIQIPQADLNSLAYFSRDFRELKASSFLKEGPGTLAGAGWFEPFVQTATSDDEIKSFVMVFRRLYMTKESGNFLRAVEAFARAILPHPVAKWVQGVAGEYEKGLNGVPDMVPFAPKDGVTFKRKRLIDVFLNTQYAHQGKERRDSQYAECLAQVGGRQAVLAVPEVHVGMRPIHAQRRRADRLIHGAVLQVPPPHPERGGSRRGVCRPGEVGEAA